MIDWRGIVRATTPAWLRHRIRQALPDRETLGLELKWNLTPMGRASRKRLESYRDRHKGERCFVIGNGPSLNKMDLRPLQNEWTFGLNRIYLLFPKMGFQTSYLVTVNKLLISQCIDDFARLSMPKFISWRQMSKRLWSENTIFIKNLYDVRFSTDAAAGLCECATVTVVALQLAYYMGFAEVILIGVDHFFSTQGVPHSKVVSAGEDLNHFDPNYFGKGFAWQLPDLAVSEIGYRLADDTFRKDGRRVLDATVGGRLRVFPKVEFDSLFPKQLHS